MPVAGCGGDDAAEQAKAATAYATRVAEITEATRRELAQTSDDANYRDAEAAADTTGQYAAAIRGAAEELASASPPASVAEQHGALVRLYRTTADRLGILAQQFGTARSGDELTQLAQALSSEVQAYSSREAQLRGEIDRALAGARGTSPAPASSPGADG